MVIKFSEQFLKDLFKQLGKEQSHKLINQLGKTTPFEGKYLARVSGTTIKEKKYQSFRFYFVYNQHELKLLSEQELHQLLLEFKAISKKNNQEQVIEKLKNELKNNNFF